MQSCLSRKSSTCISRKHSDTLWQLGLFILINLILQVKGPPSNAIVGCPTFMYMNNQSCHSCPNNCRACVSDSNCTECKTGFYGPVCNSTCKAGCTGACHKVYGYCTYGCPDGKFPAEDHMCRKCLDHCILCELQTDCVLCEDGKFGQTCQDTCHEYCLRCDKYSRQCLQCNDSFYLVEEQCKSCPYGCRSCVSDTNCTQCQESYFLQDGQCVSCTHGCRMCQTTKNCLSCQDDFVGPVDGKCMFVCPDKGVTIYSSPDKKDRCGLRQGNTTNDCNGQFENYHCTLTGNCLQHLPCPSQLRCVSDSGKQTLCTMLMSYNCKHICRKLVSVYACEANCSIQPVSNTNTSPLCMTNEVLSLAARTFKNINTFDCKQQQNRTIIHQATVLNGQEHDAALPPDFGESSCSTESQILTTVIFLYVLTFLSIIAIFVCRHLGLRMTAPKEYFYEKPDSSEQSHQPFVKCLREKVINASLF